MAATVRLFSYTGLSIAKVANYSEQQSMPALTLLKQPYLARASITADTSTAQATTTSLSPTNTRLLNVQVQNGKRVHYEITPAGQTAATADTSSPIIEGNELLDFGSGWTISLLEAS